jgi:hypothetical protein
MNLDPLDPILKSMYGNWAINVFHWNGNPLPNPIQTPEEQVTDPQPGPMTQSDIQKVMQGFDETLGKLYDSMDWK